MPSSVMDIYQRQCPRFQSASDPIAYAAHLAFISNGFQLVGLNDESNVEDHLYEGLPGMWNNTSAGIYTFRYRLNQTIIIVKCVLIDDTLIIHANRLGSDQIHTLELFVSDHLQSEYDLRDLVNVYSNLNDLVHLISDRIVQPLQPAHSMKPKSAPASLSYDENGDDDNEDPLRLPRRPIRPHGDFDSDVGPRPIDPWRPESGGSYMGPDHPMFTRGRGRGRGRIPRFDPFGPDRGFSGDPNRDLFPPPKFGGPGPGHFPF